MSRLVLEPEKIEYLWSFYVIILRGNQAFSGRVDKSSLGIRPKSCRFFF
jgi:hypothetical protein